MEDDGGYSGDEGSLSDEGSLDDDVPPFTAAGKKNINKGRWTKAEDEKLKVGVVGDVKGPFCVDSCVSEH